MKAQVRWAVAFALAAGSLGPMVAAEDAPKTLPTLLIKGEVVSLDTTDAAASLLKVKDRYGFETPIYVTSQAAITQGDQAATAAALTAGVAVEVEYNFDINTAKRHAVRVSLAAAPAAPAAAAAAPEAPAAESAPAQADAPVESAPAAEAQAEPAAATP